MVSPKLIPFRRGTICVEGNIGCGKTTLLEFFRKKFRATGEADTSVSAEPVEKWRNVDGENLFNYLYKDPSRYSLAFQTYVQLTMIKLHNMRPRLMERSIYSARYCFVENLYQLNYLSRVEFVILDKWFKHLVLPDADIINNKELEYNLLSKPTGVDIDLIIYLRCSPQKVIDRIHARSRAEEKNISMEYIKSLHDLHEDWLISRKFPVPAPVLVLDTNCGQNSLETLYEKAFPYINGDKSISKTSTIVSLYGDEMNIRQ